MIDKEIRESNDITGTYFEEGYNKDLGNIMKFYKEMKGSVSLSMISERQKEKSELIFQINLRQAFL